MVPPSHSTSPREVNATYSKTCLIYTQVARAGVEAAAVAGAEVEAELILPPVVEAADVAEVGAEAVDDAEARGGGTEAVTTGAGANELLLFQSSSDSILVGRPTTVVMPRMNGCAGGGACPGPTVGRRCIYPQQLVVEAAGEAALISKHRFREEEEKEEDNQKEEVEDGHSHQVLEEGNSVH
ncbi:hypothetical protein BT96DRAFT_1003532 [Gymnopus androsaceus JB14]|uniref:Uncharacterized protein n=1 Tax=Gymnopus androsaceus JB14 TaxID=1447944 RepID=A0A6A4GVL6_9AGAR|nr:hypothetical protein BT96DRAFT_1003532 [Gymnopus androsaceus JB14]